MSPPVPRQTARNPSQWDANQLSDRPAQLGQVTDHVMIKLLERSRDCVKILGLDGALEFMNCGGLDTLDHSEFEGVRGQKWWELWPQHTQAPVKAAFEKAREGKETEFVAECPTVQGNKRKWNVCLKPMLTDDGNIAGVVCTSRDVDAV